MDTDQLLTQIEHGKLQVYPDAVAADGHVDIIFRDERQQLSRLRCSPSESPFAKVDGLKVSIFSGIDRTASLDIHCRTIEEAESIGMALGEEVENAYLIAFPRALTAFEEG